MDFKVYFEAKERALSSELDSARALLTHSGNKGSKLEAALRSFLAQHIASKYDVGHGEVADAEGKVAGSIEPPGQIDVIVIDDSHPRFSKLDEPSLYFIEGVLAAGEVKASLKLDDCKEIVQKAAKYKMLKTELAAGDMTFSNPEDMDRFVNRRPYFLFAFKSKTPIKSFYNKMMEVQTAEGLGPTDHLDAIFFLGRGAAINIGEGQGTITSIDADGSKRKGWIQSTNPTLISMIAWLSEVMPNIHRSAPVLRKYLLRPLDAIKADLAKASSTETAAGTRH